jgi:hypothetical protein
MGSEELKGVPGGAKRKRPEKEKPVEAEVWLWYTNGESPY